MEKSVEEKTLQAKLLIDNFLSRTGVTDDSGDIKQRYLWTDAFAVQSCFALSHLLNQNSYHLFALKLIDHVHHILGKHREDESRTGWISGLPQEEGENHPTINGLRIGKKMPEHHVEEAYNPQLDWERDGQYFHYLTRWFNALLLAHEETGEFKFAVWAAELIDSGEKFIINNRGKVSMAWKMNIDLSQPVVASMGAHDPLEALICISRAQNAVSTKQERLDGFRNTIEIICRDMNWFTYDPLGIGGLLLSLKRSCDLELLGETLPAAVRPEYLFAAATAGLKTYKQQVFDSQQTLNSRLAFRECGLALGVNALYEMREKYEKVGIDFNKLENYLPLVSEINDFWLLSSSRSTSIWNDHLDINEVMLAASLLAEGYPEAF